MIFKNLSGIGLKLRIYITSKIVILVEIYQKVFWVQMKAPDELLRRMNDPKCYIYVHKILNYPMSNRITIDPTICHGKPCIRKMRWPVEVILDMLGADMSIDEILEDHPELEREDILACLQFASKTISGRSIPVSV